MLLSLFKHKYVLAAIDSRANRFLTIQMRRLNLPQPTAARLYNCLISLTVGCVMPSNKPHPVTVSRSRTYVSVAELEKAGQLERSLSHP